MANETMTLISTVTVGAGGAYALDFLNVPQTYTDLQLVFSGRTTYSATTQYWQIYVNDNNVTSGRNLIGSGSSASSNTNAFIDSTLPAANATSNTFGNGSVYIPNYTSSNNKTFSIDSVGENNATAAYQAITTLQWNSSSAITKLAVGAAGQLMVQYTTASLYGILKGSGGASVS